MKTFLCALTAVLFSAATAQAVADVRIKDITALRGLSELPVIGYGLVFGLKGTGDTVKGSPFTEQALQSMLATLGLNVNGSKQNPRNTAAVVVTADLPPFAGKGARFDISVSSIGDSTSLAGGTLAMTALLGGDHQQYAVAQGPVAASGFAVTGTAETLTQGVPTAGRIPNGAMILRESPFPAGSHELVLELLDADFTTAIRVADAINGFAQEHYGTPIAAARDQRAISIKVPVRGEAARLLSQIGALRVEPDMAARVVIDERSGTIVIGENVRISEVAVTIGSLTVKVKETENVSQPEAFSDGKTTVTPSTDIQTNQTGGQIAILRGADLQQLVHGLNAMGVKPSGIIAILQGIKTAGALHAKLVVQ